MSFLIPGAMPVEAMRKEPDRRARFNMAVAALRPHDIAMDCGANVGDISERLADTGCWVYSFEPDPRAYERLVQRLDDRPNVIISPDAVGATAGKMPLYYHAATASDPDIVLTQGSSMMADKRNVSRSRYKQVKVLDFCELLQQIAGSGYISLLKIDIEGAEAAVLLELFKRDLHRRVQVAFVETHETKVPSTVPVMHEVHAIMKEKQIKHFFLDWH